VNSIVAMLLHYVLTTSSVVRGDYVGSTHYNHVLFFIFSIWLQLTSQLIVWLLFSVLFLAVLLSSHFIVSFCL